MGKPTNRLVIGGRDLYDEYGAVLLDGFDLGCPEPKTYKVEVPGGEDIDLTDALSGESAFSNREMSFELLFPGTDGWERYRALKNEFHGRSFDVRVPSVDPATYHGRVSVTKKERQRGRTTASVTVDASPWRLLRHCTERFSAAGGLEVTLECGRCTVNPTFTCSRMCEVTMNGSAVTVQAGSWGLSNVWLTQGANTIFVNSTPTMGGDQTILQVDAAYKTVAGCGSKTVAELSWVGSKPTGAAYEVAFDYDWKDL